MQLHVLSFEGPDPYARAGGIASRIDGLVTALAAAGHDTHLWMVGDPDLPGHEQIGPHQHVHRWCQWISAYHRAGVYDGEDAKERDFSSSLPPYLMREHLMGELSVGRRAVVLAEEWHTVHAVLHLDWLLRRAGLRDRVTTFWNANNVFGFEHIDWARLANAAVLTTVSRYMRQRMWSYGVDPLVIPNGLSADAYTRPAPAQVSRFRSQLEGRAVLAKVARWDPDKRWLHSLRCIAELKRRGGRPLLIARGGAEGYGAEVIDFARALGLRIGERVIDRPGGAGLVEALTSVDDMEVLILLSHLDASARRVLYRGADAVLANSAHEPFGLVGLEAMAAGGVACTGGTGEDYVIPGLNALVVQQEDPTEFLDLFARLRADPEADAELRRAARRSSRHFAWPEVIRGNLLPRLRLPTTSPPRPASRAPMLAKPEVGRWLGEQTAVAGASSIEIDIH